MKSLILLSFVSTVAFAQPYANPMAVQQLVQQLDIVGKTIVQNCENVKDDEICEANLRKSLTLHENGHVFILKPDMAMMHEFSPYRVYVQVDKNNKIERAGL